MLLYNVLNNTIEDNKTTTIIEVEEEGKEYWVFFTT